LGAASYEAAQYKSWRAINAKEIIMKKILVFIFLIGVSYVHAQDTPQVLHVLYSETMGYHQGVYNINTWFPSHVREVSGINVDPPNSQLINLFAPYIERAIRNSNEPDPFLGNTYFLLVKYRGVTRLIYLHQTSYDGFEFIYNWHIKK
jgi:uncharacterized membrane protein